ncbi:hypothetical protein ACWG0P_04925 [Amedibacillus sp. YH-ame6]
MSKNTWRLIITYIFTFSLAFFLFLIMLLSCIRFTVMSPTFFFKTMETVDYYNNTATQLTRYIKQQARGAGFEIDVFDKFVQEEDVREKMITYEQSVLDQEQAVIDTSQFKQKLQTTIETYAQNNNIKIDANTQLSLDRFTENCINKYVYLTQFPYLGIMGNMMNLFNKVYMIVIPILLFVSVISCFFIYRLQTRNHRRKKYFAVALISAGLLISIAPATLYSMKIFEKISINPEYMYNLVVQYSRSLLVSCMIIGVFLIAFGFQVAYIKSIHKSNKHKDMRIYRSHFLEREGTISE